MSSYVISDSYMFVPTFVELDSTDIDINRKKLLDANVEYPFGEYTGLDKQNFQRKIVNIFLPIIFSICFGCSKEPSH